MRKLVLLMVFLLFAAESHGQQKYWIYLNEKNPEIKNNSPKAILEHLRTHGVVPVIYSQWLNAVSAILTESFVRRPESDSCILHVEPVSGVLQPAGLTEFPDGKSYVAVLEQINGEALIEAGYSGKGIKLGIIDAGFLNADKNRMLKELIGNDQVKGFRNFIEKESTEPYTKDYHGTQVMVHIAGTRNQHDRIHGLAYDALFYLARTDQDDKEYRGEEDYWIAALEWMHAQGVRIVNSSLGYSDGYDNPIQNYLPEQADGNSTAIAKAASIAVREKGMILVISAGNEGNRPFRVVSIPGDAEGVITVGATNLNWPWTKQGYSSVGTPGLPYVKPDVSCYSLNGTSYSAPVIAGMAAALWEARPELSNTDVAEWIRKSAHLSPFPNSFLGYGVPDGRRLVQMIRDEQVNYPAKRSIRSPDPHVQLPSFGLDVVLYHKDTQWNVLDEKVIRNTDQTVTIHRSANAKHTTVVAPYSLIEITWED